MNNKKMNDEKVRVTEEFMDDVIFKKIFWLIFWAAEIRSRWW